MSDYSNEKINKNKVLIRLPNVVKTFLIIIIASLLSLAARWVGVSSESIIMMFLLSVLITAVLTSELKWALLEAVICALLFNFLFTQPYYSFFIYRANDIILIVFFTATGIVSGLITSSLKREMELAAKNDQTSKILYRIASDFVLVSGKDNLVSKSQKLVKEYTGKDCSIILGEVKEKACDEDGDISIRSSQGEIGRIVFSEGKPEGDRLLIARAIAGQLGMALEREELVEEREKIRIAMEGEKHRSTLLRSIAHDLRSPLTALSGAGNLLADDYDKLKDSERRKLAFDISEETAWLSSLVENILGMTRINDHKLAVHKEYEVIDDIVAEAVKHAERLLSGRIFTVSLPDDVVMVRVDSKLITQVIINLIENAVRHTPKDSEIALSVEAKDKVIISVADRGQGIPEAVKDHLFEPFTRDDSIIVDGRQGLGLGLAICKTIVEAHGGEIWVDDNSPHGSVFTFTLDKEDYNA
jgi:two-component system sensor histidine kinase KdpD